MSKNIKEFSERLTIFQAGFESITKNINEQLQNIEKEINSLVENTTYLPEIKTDNKNLLNKLQELSGTIGELSMRLDRIKYEKE
ncbi:MAG: hypothetical protein GY870_08010 [archaeon]|nr:hypothetical protein [archaeon]